MGWESAWETKQTKTVETVFKKGNYHAMLERASIFEKTGKPDALMLVYKFLDGDHKGEKLTSFHNWVDGVSKEIIAKALVKTKSVEEKTELDETMTDLNKVVEKFSNSVGKTLNIHVAPKTTDSGKTFYNIYPNGVSHKFDGAELDKALGIDSTEHIPF